MRFFFYGTLIAGSGNAAEAEVHAKLRDLGPATVAGELYAIPDPEGWYPALLPGKGMVHGRLYETTREFAAADLARLDAWEDYDPAEPEIGLYRREAEGEVQVYRFARALPPGARPIPGGNFAAWLAAEGLRGFGT